MQLNTPPTAFTTKVIKLLRLIPEGKVATYGQIAALAGNHRAARQVARILHSCSTKKQLPWQRVVNKQGEISLSDADGHERQKRLLMSEGVVFDPTGRIDLARCLWSPGKTID